MSVPESLVKFFVKPLLQQELKAVAFIREYNFCNGKVYLFPLVIQASLNFYVKTKMLDCISNNE
jgi:hypothetical protein